MLSIVSKLARAMAASVPLLSIGCGGPLAPAAPAGASPPPVSPPREAVSTTCDACGDGVASQALLASLVDRSRQAKECFRRSLETSEASGTMQVRLEIGSGGSVCSAKAEADTTGSEALRSCVVDLLGKAFYPPPEEGCVVINVPLSFAITEGKAEECGRLVKWINTGVDSIGRGAPAEGAEALDALAASMDGIANEAARIPLTTEQLQAYAAAYAEMARDIAQAARAMATADRTQDTAKKNAAQVALEEAVKREDPIAESISRFCQSP